MIEKTIFDGRIEGSEKEIQEIVDMFLFENFDLPNIDFRIEKEDQKQIWVIYTTKGSAHQKKIINGFMEISKISLLDDIPVNFRLVSCRHELNLLFFQLSQKIQAKFIVRDFPPEVLTTPWRELIAQGLISPLSTNQGDLLLMENTDPTGEIPKYGRDRDLTQNQVKNIVERCRAFRERGGTVPMYYNNLPESLQNKFALETLRYWLKQKRFYQT